MMSSNLCKRSTVTCSLLALSLIILLQIAPTRSQSTASGNMCEVDCQAVYGPAFSCRGNATSGYSCEQRVCSRDCTATLDSPVCGSNGVVYRNRCELSKARCVENIADLTVHKKGQCMTLPPLPEKLCRRHQNDFDTIYLDAERFIRFMETCNPSIIDPTDLDQLIDCYRPTCNEDMYEKTQCYVGWCWCSTTSGQGNATSIRPDSEFDPSECEHTCEYEGNVYHNHEIFPANNDCGFCECIDGATTCYNDFVPDAYGQLDLDMLSQLKNTIMEMFLFQRNHDSHNTEIDLRHFDGKLSNISTSLKQIILQWKFDRYDINGDDLLSSSDHFIFREDVNVLIKCKQLNNQLVASIDSNSDGEISNDEWFEFFEVEGSSGSSESGIAEVKRSVNSGTL